MVSGTRRDFLATGAAVAASSSAIPALAGAVPPARHGATGPPRPWRRIGIRGPRPSPRSDAAMAAIGTSAYLFGGNTADGAVSDLWRLDVDGGSWSRVDVRGARPPRRFGHELLAEPSGTLLAVAGQAGVAFFGDAWRFSPRTRRWRRLGAAGPAPRYGAGGAVDARGRVYLTHGFTHDGRFDDTWLLERSFREISPPEGRPQARCLLDAAAVAGRLVVFGGQSDPLPFRDDLWALDLLGGDGWTELTPSQRPSARNRYAGAPAGRGWYVHGGLTARGPVGDLWRLDIPTAEFEAVATRRPRPAPRSSHAATVAGGRLVVFGGNDADGGPLGDTWSLDLRAARPARRPPRR